MRVLLILAATMSFASSAFGHTGAGPAAGLVNGFGHPFGGLDHVLAMAGVGLLAVYLGRRALWLVPAAFLVMMAVGGVLALAAIPVPLVELGIALSIVVVGGLVAFGRALTAVAAMAVVGAFAVFHGHAHVAEMPALASGLAYVGGFIAGTACLHGVGIAGGFALDRASRAVSRDLLRVGGAATCGLGALMLMGAL